ncbi:hypothetical protein K443DRAFT_16195 [Laccaria amethystina LaAM-08-1]|uniref:Uncharacterized protein n=1 Tax=Laccaria amethystina LaAM-08-1 TaxID=1095629 RepID=A0A0C9WY58_9AGAR|nr:hypothetical protein K443DRAFT_16195 [Laccaria amethystina LaAM-08-1]
MSSSTLMALLPHNDAPIKGGTSLEDNSSIEDIFSGLHLSPAQAQGILLALLRISNHYSTTSAPAQVSELTSGIGADDFELLPPVSKAHSFNPVASRPATTDLSTIMASPDPSNMLDHLLPDDVILVTSRSSPLNPPLASPVRPLG